MKSTFLEPLLESNQEEPDTKLFLHCIHNLTNIAWKSLVVRSQSGDVDVTVFMISKFVNYQVSSLWNRKPQKEVVAL